MTRSMGALMALLLVTAQETISPELHALAETERAFAKAATVKGIRDSFLEFFADDSITLRPTAVSAKERLRAQKPQPASVHELIWEPRTGDVAASGELGWLTGPSTFINHAAADAKPGYGNYLSVWRKQPDGTWRVYIDVGSDTPALPAFAPGFARQPFGERYKGNESPSTSTTTLVEADRDLNAGIGSKGASAAYVARVRSGSRLHRAGAQPAIGPDAIRNWLDAKATGMAAVTTTAESASSGDLGYSYGTYEVKGASPENGAYVRVWTRDAAGTWWVVADVTQPVRQ
jgi:ketosteroid isomerase-like protein